MVEPATITQPKRKASNPPASTDRSKRSHTSAESGVMADTFAAQAAPVAWGNRGIQQIPWLTADEIALSLPQDLVAMCRKSLVIILLSWTSQNIF
jgi:hypothetical protein